MKQKGQVILALILIMTVALAIGVSIVQKSLVDVTTSTRVEQSQRAFSAAEAGIENALRGGGSTAISFTETASSANIQNTGLRPQQAGVGSQQDALEYLPLSKEEFAHIWLADPSSVLNPPTEFYMPSSKTTGRGVEIYWGAPGAVDKTAVELKIIHYDSTSGYKTAVYYFDPDSARASSNGFTDVSANCSSSGLSPVNTILGSKTFSCKRIIDALSSPSFPSSGLILVRVRLLYNSQSQPLAVRGYGTCGKDCSLPPQARLIISTGVSGDTQRTLQVFQIDKVVPHYFDFAIFSAGEIRK